MATSGYHRADKTVKASCGRLHGGGRPSLRGQEGLRLGLGKWRGSFLPASGGVLSVLGEPWLRAAADLLQGREYARLFAYGLCGEGQQGHVVQREGF